MFIGMGIGLGYPRMLTNSVYTSIGFHAAFQARSQLLLTHGVLEFDGNRTLAFLALGVVPFAVGR